MTKNLDMTLMLTREAAPVAELEAVAETVALAISPIQLEPVLKTSVQYEAAFGGGSSYSLPVMGITAGNLIVVIGGAGEPFSSVTDSAGNTYVALTSTNEGPNYIRLFYCLSALTTGAVTITINNNVTHGNQGRRGIAFQFGSGKSFGGVDVGVSNGSATFTTPGYTTPAGITVCGLYCFGGDTSPHGIDGGNPDNTPLILEQETPGANVARLFGLYLPHGGQGGGGTDQTYQVTNPASNHLIRFMTFTP